MGSLALTVSIQLAGAQAKTIVVPDDFQSIQEAINNANEGDVIFVRNGTYYENVFVNKTIMLIGENRETTIIDGSRTGSILYVTEDNVTVCNLTITHSHPSQWKACGIYVNSSNNILFNNTVAENNWGICFDEAHNNNVSSNLMFNNSFGHYVIESDDNVFERNSLTNNDVGFLLTWSDYNVFNENMLAENEGSGILVVDGRFCVFERNTLVNNLYGLWLDPVSNCQILENTIVNNKVNGIRFHGYSYDNMVIGNNITGNEEGFFFHDTTRTKVLHNMISGNKRGIAIYGGSSIGVWQEIEYNDIVNNTLGLWQFEYDCGQVAHNNFVNNEVHAKNDNHSIMRWNDTYPSGGNYWSNYTGADWFSGTHQNATGSDGIGDVPYIIDEFNRDNYPLMAPVTAFDVGTWDNVSYSVDVTSNSSISDFQFNPVPTEPSVEFNVAGENSTVGFCRVTIPRSLLWVDNRWNIVVGDTQISDYGMEQDENYTYIYFTYIHSLKKVRIMGTQVIPELLSTTMLLLMSALLVSIIVAVKRRRLARVFRLKHQPLDCPP
jgi:parallel beta-helix repeat protein